MKNLSLLPFFRPVCILTLLLLVAFYDIVFLNKTLKITTASSQALPIGPYGQEDNKPRFIPVHGTDAPVQEEPLYEFIKRSLEKGIFPLWNPHQGLGYPLLGMIEVGQYFPLNYILYLLPEKYSWDILILLRILLAGIFTFYFMRELGFKKTPSLAAGIAFMLSGPMVLIQFWFINVDILLPLMLWACERLVKKASTANLLLLTFAVFLTVLAGHPEHVFLVNAFAFIFFGFRLFTRYLARPADRQNRSALIAYPAANILGFGLSAFVLFPFIYNFLFEFWHAHHPGTGLLMEEQAGRAITLALPHFFQTVPLTFQWQFSGWYGGYLGTIVLALAFLSLFKNQKRGLNYFFAVLAAIILAKEYSSPLVNWIGALPLLNKIRFAYHTPFLAAFSTAILTGMGVRLALADKKTFRKAVIFSLGLLATAGFYLFQNKAGDFLPTAWRAVGFAAGLLLVLQIILFLKDKKILRPAVAGLCLTGLLFGELFLYIHREHPRRLVSFPSVPYIEYLKSQEPRSRSYGNFWAFYPSTASAYGVDDLGYFFALVPKRLVTFANTLLLKEQLKADLRPPAIRAIPLVGREHILDLLNVRYIIWPEDRTFEKPFPQFQSPEGRFPKVYSGEVRVFERPDVFPRVFVVHRAIFEPRESSSLALLARLGPLLRGVAVINSPPILPVMAALKDTPLKDDSSARIIKYTPNEVVLEAIMENPGIVVFSDAYHPDWNVYVNGAPWKVLQTNQLLRGVFLPKGIFKIKFAFEPASLYFGAWVSFLCCLIILTLAYFSNKRSNPNM